MDSNKYDIINEPTTIFVKKLGDGAYGEVYEDENGDAIKIYTESENEKKMNPNIDGYYGFSSCLFREISNMCKLDYCKYVPKVKEIYFGKKYGFKMDKYDYSLDNMIQNKKFNNINLQYVIYQIVTALAEAQKNGIIHRDVKPHNILINENYKLVLSDWGLSIVLYAEHLKKSTRLVQTLWYRCPEHLLNDIETMNNNTIDMWSIGIIMIELITGQLGFIGTNDEEKCIEKLIKILGIPKNERILKLINKKFGSSILTTNKIVNFFDTFKIKYNLSNECIDFIIRLLEWDSKNRLDPLSALKHEYMNQFVNNCNNIEDDEKQLLLKYNSDNNIDEVDRYINILSNLKTYNIDKYENIKNKNYLCDRMNYINSYKSICKLINVGVHELGLMVLYTDKIMSGNELSYSSNIISCSIASIVSMYGLEATISPQNMGLLLMDNDITAENIKKCINDIIKIINFPLAACTFVTYENILLLSYHSSISKIYKNICNNLLLNYDSLIYKPEEVFGSILDAMGNYIYINRKNKNDIYELKNILYYLSSLFPKTILIQINKELYEFYDQEYEIYLFY